MNDIQALTDIFCEGAGKEPTWIEYKSIIDALRLRYGKGDEESIQNRIKEKYDRVRKLMLIDGSIMRWQKYSTAKSLYVIFIKECARIVIEQIRPDVTIYRTDEPYIVEKIGVLDLNQADEVFTRYGLAVQLS